VAAQQQMIRKTTSAATAVAIVQLSASAGCMLSDFPMYFYFGTKTTSSGSPALKMRAPPPHIVWRKSCINP
jgi:hypothetical protein